jgi:hypothetical protein
MSYGIASAAWLLTAAAHQGIKDAILSKVAPVFGAGKNEKVRVAESRHNHVEMPHMRYWTTDVTATPLPFFAVFNRFLPLFFSIMMHSSPPAAARSDQLITRMPIAISATASAHRVVFGHHGKCGVPGLSMG